MGCEIDEDGYVDNSNFWDGFKIILHEEIKNWYQE